MADLLVMESDLLLLDEPTAWLDPPNSNLVTKILDDLAKRGISLLIATHDVNWAYSFGDRMIMLRNGKIQFDGDIIEGFNNVELLRTLACLVHHSSGMRYLTRRDHGHDGPVPRNLETFERWLVKRKSTTIKQIAGRMICFQRKQDRVAASQRYTTGSQRRRLPWLR